MNIKLDRATLHAFFWVTPFLFFILGNVTIRRILKPPTAAMPNILGLQADKALLKLGEYKLTCQIYDIKEDADLPSGTIVSQIPSPHTLVKSYQTVYVALSTTCQAQLMPLCIKQKKEDLEKLFIDKKVKYLFLPHTMPYGMCFAQKPDAHALLEQPIVYFSNAQKYPVIWPSFIGQSLDMVLERLREYGIEPEIITASKQHKGIITDQRPYAGTFIELKKTKLPLIQFYVT